MVEPIDVQLLMDAHSEGDPDAFEHLFATIQGDLWGYLVNSVRDNADAEDLYQDISIKAYRNLPKLREPDRFRSWIFAIAVNTVRGFFRRKPLVLVEEEETLNQPTPQADPRQSLETRQELEQLRTCLRGLPEQDRQILILDTMVELPQQEIADQLGMNLNTVKTRLRRAKIKLARRMAEVAHG